MDKTRVKETSQKEAIDSNAKAEKYSMNDPEVTSLLQELLSLHRETEWVEFKANRYDPQTLGEYLSADVKERLRIGDRVSIQAGP